MRQLHAWKTGSETKADVRRWFTFYDHQWPHAALSGQPPAVVYVDHIETEPLVQAVA